MSDEYALAFKLLGVGMITVFLILFLVVAFGNIIISVVNKYFPEAEKVLSSQPDKGINRKKLAAITAAVNIVTKGKGKITKIEKF